MSGRPYPTPNRLRVMREIAAGELEHHHFIDPLTVNKVTDRNRSAIVREFVDAGLAEIPQPADAFSTSIVVLTADGQQYLDTYGKNGADT